MRFYSHIKHALFILLAFSCVEQFSAQDYSYKHYGVEDGLPSSETYSAFQDSKGYIWFATDAGVSRFNGYEFENFDVSDGLTDNTVFLIREDHKGRIWFGTFNNQLSYYENDSIYPFIHNDKIGKTLIKEKPMESFYVDKNENIWIGSYGEGINKIDKNGDVRQMIIIPEGLLWLNKAMSIEGNIITGSLGREEYFERIKENKDFFYEQKSEYNNDVSFVSRVNYFNERGNIKSGATDSLMLLFHGDRVDIIKSDGSVYNKSLPEGINKRLYSVMTDDKYVWLCSVKEGVYKCTIKDDSLVVVNHFLEEKNVSRVYQDKDGGSWFMTLNEGVYYLSNEFMNITRKELVHAIEIDTTRGELYTAVEHNVYVRKNDVEKKLTNIKTRYMALKFDYNNDYIVIGTGHTNPFLEVENKYLLKGKYGMVKTTGLFADSNVIYATSSSGLVVMANMETMYNSLISTNESVWCTSLVKVKKKLLVGTNKGVRVLENNKWTSPFKDNKYLSSAITSIEQLNENRFIVGTKSYGLIVLEKDSIIDIIDEAVGLSGNLVKTIHVDNQQTIWAGTNDGLSRIEYVGVNNYEVYNLTKNHGLITDEITAIKSYQNIIYVATPKGLMEFDKNRIKVNMLPPQIYISTFKVNSEERTIDDNLTLNYQENFINIKFEGLNYRSLGKVEYQYRMLGVDSNWTTTITRSVQYPTLQPGEYTFEVKAQNEDGFWSKPTKISFTITPPFWLTWWFVGGEIFLALFIMFIIFKYREKQLVTKNEAATKITNAEKRMVELELKALRSQMNPHFIFNTLNSIQHYIATNDFKSTNKYLTQFARLIRTVLNLSEKNLITIQEEVDMLTLYMNLEKMRFEEQFEYEITIDDKIDSDYDEIPSMLLQPYIENAIWHGLMNKNEKGRIKIKIDLEENYLCCSVEDNGIGRKKAQEIKDKRIIEQKSVGMSITQERLDIIGDNEVNVEIIDLLGKEGQALGTRISIKIPYKNE